MRGTEALEAEEEGGIVDSGGILAPKNSKMNGTNGNKNGASSDVKYPANCAMRLSSTPGSEGDGDDPYEPKQNKKIVRILTVLIYVFTVSFGKFFKREHRASSFLNCCCCCHCCCCGKRLENLSICQLSCVFVSVTVF